MNVCVSAMGRFHAFNLAEGLERAGVLQRFITTYPKFFTSRYHVPESKVVSLWPMEIVHRGLAKLPESLKKRWDAQISIHDGFDRWASACLPRETDIFVGWSSNCLHSLRKAKKRGALAVVDEGSTHASAQTQILNEEHERLGLPTQAPNRRIVEKELREYEEADYIFVPSSFVEKTFLERGIERKKLRRVHYGVDPEQFKPGLKDDGVFRVIHCGALSVRKGVHYLLQAFYEMNLPDAELWLVGPLSREIIPFLKKYDNGKVFHKGPFPQDKLLNYYGQGSVFCLASIEEGFAMVILQAMACGLPVIATTNTGAEDMIENGKEGFIVPIRDVQAIKEKLFFLHGNPRIRDEMGKASRSKVLAEGTWQVYGERMVKAFGEIFDREKL